MRAARVWRSVLGIEHTVIEWVEIEEQGEAELVVAGDLNVPRLPTRARSTIEYPTESRVALAGGPFRDENRCWRSVDVALL